MPKNKNIDAVWVMSTNPPTEGYLIHRNSTFSTVQVGGQLIKVRNDDLMPREDEKKHRDGTNNS